jgi:hypothetical protein
MTDGMDMTTEELLEEQKYNLIGFGEVAEALKNVDTPTQEDPLLNQALAKSIMDDTVFNYFEKNEEHYVNPEIRKYIFSGATMAFLYWLNANPTDGGNE